MSALRLAVVEAPIDALSLAALEGPRADTLYLATAGGIGPETIKALEALLAERAGRPDTRLVAATDADRAGDRYADLLHTLAEAAGVQAVRLRPPAAAGDWNEVLVRARQGRRGDRLPSLSTPRAAGEQIKNILLFSPQEARMGVRDSVGARRLVSEQRSA